MSNTDPDDLSKAITAFAWEGMLSKESLREHIDKVISKYSPETLEQAKTWREERSRD